MDLVLKRAMELARMDAESGPSKEDETKYSTNLFAAVLRETLEEL